MTYGTINKEYIVTLSYSSRGKLKGETRHCIVEFLDEDTGERKCLGEPMSMTIFKMLNLDGGDDDGES